MYSIAGVEVSVYDTSWSVIHMKIMAEACLEKKMLVYPNITRWAFYCTVLCIISMCSIENTYNMAERIIENMTIFLSWESLKGGKLAGFKGVFKTNLIWLAKNY